MSIKQRTIQHPVTVSGTGLHTGIEVNLTFCPAPVNTGYVYRRVDLEGKPEIPVDANLVTDTSRGTTLELNGARVATVEHPLAALAGLGIDNCFLEMDGLETPIMDGSSRFFVEAIEKAGIVEQDAEREYLEIKSPVSFSDRDKKVEMIALPADDFKVSVMIDYETTVLDTQNAILEKMSDFRDQISGCRTFVFLHELEALMNHNLIKGGDLSNAIVFVNRIVSQPELDRLAGLLNKPTVEVTQTGILNNLELRFQNEPARHKLLDVIGDLTLVGKPIKAHIIARRPGHSSNVRFAKALKDHASNEKKISDVPLYDLTKDPIYDINAIKRMLPHRFPFLLIDKVIEISEDYVVGVKNVTYNENFFVGHFPAEPVMPGVLMIEAMAQTGGVFVLSHLPDPENYDTYFLKINEVKFRHKVVPGDTIIFRLELLSPLRRGICHMKGVAYVGKKIVLEAILLAQIFRRKHDDDPNISDLSSYETRK
ncbi:MAG: bifunctional UDP-3-O-[3-hydroxymyristoyl] N-acetylglucosamine deacetylase/3-hydroxyacyl-ACP dehydratase [Bacteroidales bacterium]